MRPFSESAQIDCRSYSSRLQRAMVDFGSDEAFHRVSAKLQEHYGIEVPVSAARHYTEWHAQRIFEQERERFPARVSAAVEVVIAQSDGSMLPIVETGHNSGRETPNQDKRKGKKLFWKEVKLSMAHAKGSVELEFAGTLEGVEVAGNQLVDCVKRAGAGNETQVHCVGDGARWIAEQVETHFGVRGHYLIDFYHLCEYLGSAAAICAPGNETAWLDKQKEAMKHNQYQAVLIALQPYLEPSEQEGPVRACYRYIKNRPEQFDYQSAIADGLPIGSGEIESAHRYVLQKRMKLPGGWWKMNNAKHMVALRICRANKQWDDYWMKKAA